MTDYNSPHNIIGYAVVAMNYIIACVYNPTSRSNFDIWSEFQKSVHCFANYGYVTFNGAAQAYI